MKGDRWRGDRHGQAAYGLRGAPIRRPCCTGQGDAMWSKETKDCVAGCNVAPLPNVTSLFSGMPPPPTTPSGSPGGKGMGVEGGSGHPRVANDPTVQPRGDLSIQWTKAQKNCETWQSWTVTDQEVHDLSHMNNYEHR